MSLFTNGNARITRLIIVQLALSSLSLLIMQIQGFLPALDFLTPKELKITSFSLSVSLVAIEAGKMFFNKTVALLKGQRDDETPVVVPYSQVIDLPPKPPIQTVLTTSETKITT